VKSDIQDQQTKRDIQASKERKYFDLGVFVLAQNVESREQQQEKSHWMWGIKSAAVSSNPREGQSSSSIFGGEGSEGRTSKASEIRQSLHQRSDRQSLLGVIKSYAESSLNGAVKKGA